jgi:two-component system, sensor histidine kinase and response regulator
MPNTFDINALIEELELDKEDIVELMDDFKDFITTALPNLENAINSGDTGEVRSVAHSIKGSAGNLRINFVYETAKTMQDAADAGEGDKLKELLPTIKTQIEEFIEESKDL